jgi:hypothetical protein
MAPDQRFVHLDVQTACDVGGSSPSLPEDYVRALTRQSRLDADTPEDQPPPAIAFADYGLR